MKKIVIAFLMLIIPYHGSQEATNIKVFDLFVPPAVEKRIEFKNGVANDIVLLHPAFRNKVIQFLFECRRQGIELMVLETYRTPERQDSLKAKGRSTLSGGRSKHQYNLAIDVVPVVNGKLKWHNRKLWNKIGEIGEGYGLHWGGRWKRFFDPGHFEYNCLIEEIDNIPQPDTLIIMEHQWVAKNKKDNLFGDQDDI